MHTGDFEGPSPSPRDDLQPGLATASVLIDAVRRRVFQIVRRARRSVTRDEAASAAGISRNLAAFHLDKLVEAGLLTAGTQTRGGVGRRPKVYGLGGAEVHVDVPRRQHRLLADVLVKALQRDESGDARRTAMEEANRQGRALGAAARAESGEATSLAGAYTAIESLGFEPYQADPGVVRLGNCPFRPLALESPELVCGLNQSLLDGLLDGLGAAGVEAELAPRPGECCVQLTARQEEERRSIR
ncbi:MAG: helix-turn-helix domain-containing protein [Candidatus Dormibacteraeota bacterium]|nr:helix-turn-helix domain-containing protein [Candidatus Dormibacteraeota bacterium]